MLTQNSNTLTQTNKPLNIHICECVKSITYGAQEVDYLHVLHFTFKFTIHIKQWILIE